MVHMDQFTSIEQSGSTHDLSSPDKGKMKLLHLEQFLSEIKNQPQWRYAANIEAGYYDNNQYDAETLRTLIERGQPIITTNLIKPVIDSIVGVEIRNRTDWVVRSEREEKENNETAEALTVEIKEAERMSKADKACTKAYISQVKTGIGWAEVIRNPDPFGYPILVNHIHRNEIYWDWRSKHPLMDDARYLVRKRWLDEDLANMVFPKFKEILKNSFSDWRGFDDNILSATDSQFNDGILDAYGVATSTRMAEDEWLDAERKRIAVHEVWYRTWIDGYIMRMEDGTALEFDKENPRHVEAVSQDAVGVEKWIFNKTRVSFWLGPHRVVDKKTPYNHNWFPYVPFIGHREDTSNIPYGMIRMMRSSQDEVNARRAKLMFLLSAKRVITDADAVEDHNRTKDEVSRADAYIILNEDRKNQDGFKVETDLSLASQQFDVLQDAKSSLQDVAGTYTEKLDKAESGVMVNSLIDQGNNDMAEINDNFKEGRTRVGEMVLSLLVEDLSGKEKTIKIDNGGVGKPKRVTINKNFIDDEGIEQRSNDITTFRTKLVLDDVPQTATHRQQQFTYLMEIAKSLPEDVMSTILPDLIMFSEMPNRAEIAKNLKRQMGVSQDPEDMTEEEISQEKESRRVEEENTRLEKETILAEKELKKAQVNKVKAETIKLAAEAASLAAGSPENAAIVDDMLEMADGKDIDMQEMEEQSRRVKQDQEEQQAAEQEQLTQPPVV